MKSDVIKVSNKGAGLDVALRQTELVCSFKGLGKKESLHMRLLTEEMMGMMNAITGEHEALFWIEDNDRNFELHLKAETIMNSEMRKRLLSASTSGKNSAAKGVLGKLRDIFERLLEPEEIDLNLTGEYAEGWTYAGADYTDFSMATAGIWSFNQYRQSAKEDTEEWDELEKSIIAKIADEVKIAIADDTVEMIIYKKF